MGNDPRESITVAGLRVTESPVDEVWIVGDSRDEYWAEAGRADWPEVVAFAKAILAADSEWQDSQTPTLEELRERYPDFYMNVDTHPLTNTTWFAAFYPVGDEMNPRYGSNMESEKAALRWLAAELAKQQGKEMGE